MSEDATQLIEKNVKKNGSVIKVALAFGAVFTLFAIVNAIVPLIGCLTIFIIWILKFDAGILIGEMKSVTKQTLTKSDTLTSIGIYSIVTALLEGIIAGIVGMIWGLIFTPSAFAIAVSLVSIVLTTFFLIIGNFVFTILGALIYAYADHNTLKPVISFNKSIRNVLKI